MTVALAARFQIETGRHELDESFGLGRAANAQFAQFGVRKFNGPASLTRNFGNRFVRGRI